MLTQEDREALAYELGRVNATVKFANSLESEKLKNAILADIPTSHVVLYRALEKVTAEAK